MGRRAFAPAVAGRLAVARGVVGDAEREEAGRSSLCRHTEGASCGLIRPDVASLGVGKKGLTSASYLVI